MEIGSRSTPTQKQRERARTTESDQLITGHVGEEGIGKVFSY